MMLKMSEQLLSVDHVAMKLSISKRHAQLIIPDLEAKGLQRVKISPRCIRFRELSLNNLIKSAAERGETLS